MIAPGWLLETTPLRSGALTVWRRGLEDSMTPQSNSLRGSTAAASSTILLPCCFACAAVHSSQVCAQEFAVRRQASQAAGARVPVSWFFGLHPDLHPRSPCFKARLKTGAVQRCASHLLERTAGPLFGVHTEYRYVYRGWTRLGESVTPTHNLGSRILGVGSENLVRVDAPRLGLGSSCDDGPPKG